MQVTGPSRGLLCVPVRPRLVCTALPATQARRSCCCQAPALVRACSWTTMFFLSDATAGRQVLYAASFDDLLCFEHMPMNMPVRVCVCVYLRACVAAGIWSWMRATA